MKALMLNGARAGQEITEQLDGAGHSEQDLLLIYSGLLAALAGALSKRVGIEVTHKLLDTIKAGVTAAEEPPVLERRH